MKTLLIFFFKCTIFISFRFYFSRLRLGLHENMYVISMFFESSFFFKKSTLDIRSSATVLFIVREYILTLCDNG